jgi:hypothetical protein
LRFSIPLCVDPVVAVRHVLEGLQAGTLGEGTAGDVSRGRDRDLARSVLIACRAGRRKLRLSEGTDLLKDTVGGALVLVERNGSYRSFPRLGSYEELLQLLALQIPPVSGRNSLFEITWPAESAVAVRVELTGAGELGEDLIFRHMVLADIEGSMSDHIPDSVDELLPGILAKAVQLKPCTEVSRRGIGPAIDVIEGLVDQAFQDEPDGIIEQDPGPATRSDRSKGDLPIMGLQLP